MELNGWWVFFIILCVVILFFFTVGKMSIDCDNKIKNKIKEKNDADANTCEQMYIGCANTVDQCLTKFSADLMRKSRSSDTTSGTGGH